MTKNQILHYKFLKELVKLHYIDEIWLFGSRARDDYKDNSDIDLAILCSKATNSQWMNIVGIIEEADTLLKIDCVRFDELDDDETFKANIIKYKKVLYTKKGNFTSKLLWEDLFIDLRNAIERLNESLLTLNESRLSLSKLSELQKKYLPNFDNKLLKLLESEDILRNSVIQSFEFTIELFWKVLKKFLDYEKIETNFPREVFKESFQRKMIYDEQIWLEMLDDKNNSSHAYKLEKAIIIYENIKRYAPILEKTYQELQNRFERLD